MKSFQTGKCKAENQEIVKQLKLMRKRVETVLFKHAVNQDKPM